MMANLSTPAAQADNLSVWQRFGLRRKELGLLVAAALIVTIALADLELSQDSQIAADMLWISGGFLGVFALAHIVLCLTAPYADQVMLPTAALLNGIGLIMIHRIDMALDNHLAIRQVMWSLIAVILMIVVLLAVRDHRVLTRYSYVLGLVGLILLALPMVWPLPDDMVADARIWITIGSFTLQPGEFSKILLLLFFAQLLNTKRALFNTAGKRFLGLEFPRLRDLGPIFLVWALALLIMAGENDFGPALLLFGTVLGMLYLATNRPSWLIIGLGLVAIGGTGVYQISDKIQTRVENFIDPLGNYDNNGMQLSQALFGMSYGGVTGTGLGQGYPYLVPVPYSDYILAALGEEIGLIGFAAILVLFAIFISRGFKTALLVRDSYGKLVASGLSLTLIIQVFVVVGGISALIPMTGLTTPFISAGGSSMMANYMLLGLLLRISDTARRPKIGVQQ